MSDADAGAGGRGSRGTFAGYSRRACIRVFVADDHGVLRRGLRALINAQDDMEVVGEAA